MALEADEKEEEAKSDTNSFPIYVCALVFAEGTSGSTATNMFVEGLSSELAEHVKIFLVALLIARDYSRGKDAKSRKHQYKAVPGCGPVQSSKPRFETHRPTQCVLKPFILPCSGETKKVIRLRPVKMIGRRDRLSEFWEG